MERVYLVRQVKAKSIPVNIGDKFTICEQCESGLWDKKRKKPAGTLNKDGYWIVSFQSKRYPAHRVVWFLKNNKDPGDLQVDHIDRDKNNNKIANLRAVTPKVNNNNRDRTNLGRHKGVNPLKIYKRKRVKGYKYQLVEYVGRKQVYYGTFDTYEEALSVRLAIRAD